MTPPAMPTIDHRAPTINRLVLSKRAYDRHGNVLRVIDSGAGRLWLCCWFSSGKPFAVVRCQHIIEARDCIEIDAYFGHNIDSESDDSYTPLDRTTESPLSVEHQITIGFELQP